MAGRLASRIMGGNGVVCRSVAFSLRLRSGMGLPVGKHIVPYKPARMQVMIEKEVIYVGNGDANSHVCKVCFESPIKAMFLPVDILVCVNHVHLPVLNAQFAGPRLQIEFLLSLLDICSLPPSK